MHWIKCGLLVIVLIFPLSCTRINKNFTLLEAKKSYHEGNFPRAFQLTEILAYQGDPKAQYALGYMYYYGIAAPQNKSLAVAWFKQAAEKGNISAKNALQTLLNVTGEVVYTQPLIIPPPPMIKEEPLSLNIDKAPIMEPEKKAETIPEIIVKPDLASENTNNSTLGSVHTSKPDATQAWVMQLATYSKPNNAKCLVDKLEHAGIKAHSKNILRQQEKFTVVYIGPIKDKEEAIKLRETLQSEYKLDPILFHHTA